MIILFSGAPATVVATPATIDPGLWLLLFGSAGATPPVMLFPAFAPYRDADIYDDIMARLNALGLFSAVHDSESDSGPASADEIYLCRMIPGDAEDDDDVDPIDMVRRGTYALLIEVREEDPATRRRTIDLVANTVKNALNGKSLAALTLPPLTRIRRDRQGGISGPTQTLTLAGEWAYFVPGYDSFNTTA